MVTAIKKLKSSRLNSSRRALAIPITFLVLFVSTLALISVTYAFAVQRVNSQSQDIKISTAKQNMISLDDNILSVTTQTGSARSFDIQDSGGQTKIEPNTNSLAINISDNIGINKAILNEAIGQISYELPSSYSSNIGFYLKGDSRTVTNQSGSIVTQLSIERGIEHPKIQLSYRPTVSFTKGGTQDNKSVNNLRVYVINLNNSEPVTMYGRIPLRISCESTQVISETYSVDYSLETLEIASTINDLTGQVLVPISSTAQGAIIHIEIVQSNIKIERSLV